MGRVNSRQIVTMWLTAFAILLMYAFPPIGRESRLGNVTPSGYGYLTSIPSDFVLDYNRLLFQILIVALLAACLMVSNQGPYSSDVRGGRLLLGLVLLLVGGGLLTWWLRYAPVYYYGRGVEWHPRNKYVGDARLVVSEDIKLELLVALLLGLGVYLTLTALGLRTGGRSGPPSQEPNGRGPDKNLKSVEVAPTKPERGAPDTRFDDCADRLSGLLPLSQNFPPAPSALRRSFGAFDDPNSPHASRITRPWLTKPLPANYPLKTKPFVPFVLPLS